MGNEKLQLTIDTTKKITKKSRLLSNPEIKRWYENNRRGSKQTAEVNLRRLSKFCEDHQITPLELVEIGMKDNKTMADMLQDHVTWLEEQGKAPGYIKKIITGVKSWLTHNDIEIRRKIKISNVTATPTLQNERVPEPDELAELFNRAELRSGAIMALIGKAGLRPEVLANYDAMDGLTIKDLPDLAFVKGLATFIRTPPMIVVRQNLSKTGHEYCTFITDLGAKRLLAYLNDRMLSGESLGPDAAVIAPHKTYVHNRGKNAGKKFVTTAIIERDVRITMRPRFNWRPYVLRAFFDTELLIAESRGKIAHDFRVFFMGHKGSIEATYTTNKGILPKALLDEMRESFKRSEEFLDLEKKLEDPVQKKKEEVKEDIEKLNSEQLAKVQELVSSF
jgi:hypothetical protein